MTQEQLKERAEKEYPQIYVPIGATTPTADIEHNLKQLARQEGYISGYLARQGEEREGKETRPYTYDQLVNMLEDVVNELDLSEKAVEKHGPLATPPADLVRLVLAEKDLKIKALQAGFKNL